MTSKPILTSSTTSNIPLLQSNALSTVIQAQLFSRTQEDVLCTIFVVPDSTSNDVDAKSKKATTPFVLTISVTRTKSGYKDPKIHEIKAKLNGEFMLKTSRSLKSIERFLLPQGFSEMLGYVDNTGKKIMWSITSLQMITHSLQTSFTTNNSIREEFVWWCLTVSLILNKAEIKNPLDSSIQTNIFQYFAKILSANSQEIWDPTTGIITQRNGNVNYNNNSNETAFTTNLNSHGLSPSSFSPLQRYLINALVDKKRQQAESQQIDGLSSNFESQLNNNDLLVLPDMSLEEAETLNLFVEQGNLSISRIGDLEQYLQVRLIELQSATIQDVFYSRLSHNAELLSSLLDGVLDHVEEIDSWTQTYDATISIMAQGIKKIESQGEILDVEDANYVNLTIVLLWLLTEITLTTRTYSVLQDRRFRVTDIDQVIRACLQLDSLLTSTRLTVDNAGLLPTKPTAAKENAKRRITFPLFSLGKKKDQNKDQNRVELVKDGLDHLLTDGKGNGANAPTGATDDKNKIVPKSNTSTGEVEKGRFERKNPQTGANPISTGLINVNSNNYTAIQTAGGGTSSVAAALQAAGINLNATNDSLQNTDLAVVMEQKTETYRSGLIDFTAFSGLASVIQKKKEFRLLASSTANAINTKLYNIFDSLFTKYSNYPISEPDLYKIKNGSVNEIMLTKMKYKLSIEKYKSLHQELLQYKPLVGICERLSPGHVAKFREEYCRRFCQIYNADIKSFFDKLSRVIHGSSVDCRLRSSPAINLNELQTMANIYRDAVLKGKKAENSLTQTMLGMKAKIFHTEQISSLSPPPAGKMYASDVFRYAIERCMAIIQEEQLFLLNMFIIWEETDISMMYRTMIENPLIEMGKKYTLYPDKANPDWIKACYQHKDREKEMLVLFKNIPLQVPSAERDENNPRSLPPQKITQTKGNIYSNVCRFY